MEERCEVYRYSYNMRLNELTKAGVQKKREVYAPNFGKKKKSYLRDCERKMSWPKKARSFNLELLGKNSVAERVAEGGKVQ